MTDPHFISDRAVSWPRRRLLFGVLLLAACAALASPPAAHAAWPEPLPAGRESMYADLNQGALRTADDLLRNVWPARGYPSVQLVWPLTWTEDPYNDAYWRFMFYSLRYTSNLLWAYGTTGDVRYRDRLVEIFRSYANYDAARGFDRLTFDNNHAAAYRAMVLVNTYRKLERWNALPPDLAASLRASIERLGNFLFTPRNFESGFNHGFNEAAALLLVADSFPDMFGAATWRATAVERLREMVRTNIDADGVDVENSPFYHYYVLGMVAQIARWANAFAPELAFDFDNAQRAMLPYAAAIVQPNGRLPMLGATATTVVPSQDPAVYGPLADLDSAFAWVFTRGARGIPPAAGVRLFPTSGLFLLRSETPAAYDLAGQTFLTFDSGLYRTDHSHLDALSITYFSDGTALMPDSGLYTYLPGADFDYFHGTRSHNTVVVDGLDQAEGAAIAGAHGAVGGVAWATGTSDLYTGVRHVRTVALIERGLVVVVDGLSSANPHRYVQTWHLFPGASVQSRGKDVTLLDPAGTPRLALSEADWNTLSLATMTGTTSPMQGWLSSAYGSKEPNSALEYTRTAASARFVTLLASGPYAATKPTVRQAWLTGQNRRRLWVCAGTASYTLTLFAQGAPTERLEVERGGGCP